MWFQNVEVLVKSSSSAVEHRSTKVGKSDGTVDVQNPDLFARRKTASIRRRLGDQWIWKSPTKPVQHIGELRDDNSAEHLSRSRHRHPVRLQDENGVHGPRRRVDDIVHVHINRQCVGKRNAKYSQRRNSCNVTHHGRRCRTTSLPVVPEQLCTLSGRFS